MNTAQAQHPFNRTLRRLTTEAAIVVGAVSVAVLYTVGKGWVESNSAIVLTLLSLWLFGVMLWLAFGAVRHADAIAHALGEPLGTIVLTLSVICIEVALVVTVSLTGQGTPTLARDTMYSVVMVVLNGLVGVCLLTGGIRHREQSYDLRGANAYLSVLIPLAVLGLILPRFTTGAPGGQLSPMTGAFLAVMSAGLYVIFLIIQTLRHQNYFAEPASTQASGTKHGRGALWLHALFLLVLLVSIVLLSKKFAVLVNRGIEQTHAPVALGGLIVALLVLAPEGMTAFRASLENQLQRTMNLLFGAALSTIGLTIPAMLIVSRITGRPLELGLDYAQATLLALTLGMCAVHFSGQRTTVLQGVVHLVLFVSYVMLIFD